MANNGPARAWQFLKCNPDYRAGWRAAAPPAPLEPAPFPLRARSRADAAAAAWGLLAWADPDGGDELPSPFWADTPMVEAESAPPGARGAPAFVPLFREAGARLSGLWLSGGALLLNIESEDDAMQVRIADGGAFDPRRGLVLRQSFGLGLPVNLAHAGDLWAFACAGVKKARATAAGWMTPSCCSPSTGLSAARPTAA